MAASSRILRTAEGEIRLYLSDAERELLRTVSEELKVLLADDDDPALQRLFPPAHDDPEREREYRELTRAQLVTGRERALDVLLATLGRDRLSSEEGDAWLRALNDARLVLGTRLDVVEDMDWDELDFEDPRAHELAVYGYLSWIQEELVAATNP